VTSKDGLHGGIFSFDRLKSSQRSIYPVLGQMIQNCVGRWSVTDHPLTGSARCAPVVRQSAPETAGFSRSQPDWIGFTGLFSL
jgi:hypothetical protein